MIVVMECMLVGVGVVFVFVCDWCVFGEGVFFYVLEVKIGINL